MTTHRSLWFVDAGVIVYAAIGAALFGILGLVDTPLLGSRVDLRPAFALVVFFGYSFGPVAGLVVGLVGRSILAQITGAGIAADSLDAVACGLAGLVAGLAPLYLGRWMHGPLVRRAIGGGLVGIVASVVGFLFFLASGITAEYLPRALGGALVSVVLVPLLAYAWEPLGESLAG